MSCAEGGKSAFYIWIYPDNPMSVMVDIFLIGVALYLLYLILFHNLIGEMIRQFKHSTIDFERQPIKGAQKHKMYGENENIDIDVNHEIGQALRLINDPDLLTKYTTRTGVNAYEVYRLMYFIWRDLTDVVYGSEDYVIIEDGKREYSVGEGSLELSEDGTAEIKTSYGNINTEINELKSYIKNPYNFSYLAVQLNLV